MRDVIATSAAVDIEPGKIEPLTDEERAEIEHEFVHYPFKQAATIEALKIVQKYQGWVSDGKVKAIAKLLEVSPDDVDGVATFYNKIYRKPVGKTVLAVCDSVSCWVMGCQQTINYIGNKLNIVPGQTTRDGKYTLLPTPCLGACDKGPVMMLGEELVTNLTNEKLDELIGGREM
jgi:NADH-quinone oxidoreductase subunit E